MSVDITFHYPPELFNLLIETIARLVRGKRDVLLFFRGAGVPQQYLSTLTRQVAKDRDAVTKFEIVRIVLTTLNETGESSLEPRREVLKRVYEWEDFSSCWENQRLEAQGLVAQVRRLTDVKDTFTRIKDEREKERAERRKIMEARERELAMRQATRERIKKELASLFAVTDPWKRGKLLEEVLNKLFAYFGILVSKAFTLRGKQGEGTIEQIDGVIEFDSDLYLVEMKWHGTPLGVPEVAQHLVRVFTRDEARALIVSDSGFTKPAIAQCREALTLKVVILCELQEIVNIMESDASLLPFLRTKVRAAIVEKEPLIRVLSGSL